MPESVRAPSSTRNRASEPELHQRTLESKNEDEGGNKGIENYVAELTTDGGQGHGRHCHALVRRGDFGIHQTWGQPEEILRFF